MHLIVALVIRHAITVLLAGFARNRMQVKPGLLVQLIVLFIYIGKLRWNLHLLRRKRLFLHLPAAFGQETHAVSVFRARNARSPRMRCGGAHRDNSGQHSDGKTEQQFFPDLMKIDCHGGPHLSSISMVCSQRLKHAGRCDILKVSAKIPQKRKTRGTTCCLHPS